MHTIFFLNFTGKFTWDTTCRWRGYIRIELKQTEGPTVGWIRLAQDINHWQSLVTQFHKQREILQKAERMPDFKKRLEHTMDL